MIYISVSGHDDIVIHQSRSVRLNVTFDVIVSSVPFFHFIIPRKWLPLFSTIWDGEKDRQWESTSSQNYLVEKNFGPRFGCRGFRFSRRENGRGGGGRGEGAIPWSLSSWPRKVPGSSREQSLLTLLLCLPSLDYPNPLIERMQMLWFRIEGTEVIRIWISIWRNGNS